MAFRCFKHSDVVVLANIVFLIFCGIWFINHSKTTEKCEIHRVTISAQMENGDTNHDVTRVRKKKSTINKDKDEIKIRPPKTIIIGAQKCGTSTLLRFLGLHPDIVRSYLDETHYFLGKYHNGPQWYMKQFPPHNSSQIGIEKTPFYFNHIPLVPERIKEFNSSMKLILILCDPVKRSISSWVQFLHSENRSHTTPAYSFEKMYATKKKDGKFELQTNSDLFQYGIYHKLIQRWMEWFPLRQIHVVDGETFVKDPLTEIKLVEKFLGIQNVVDDSMLEYDDKKGFYCIVKKMDNSKNKRLCMDDRKGRPHPPVNQKVVKLMEDFFKPHGLKLNKLIGRKMSWT